MSFSVLYNLKKVNSSLNWHNGNSNKRCILGLISIKKISIWYWSKKNKKSPEFESFFLRVILLTVFTFFDFDLILSVVWVRFGNNKSLFLFYISRTLITCIEEKNPHLAWWHPYDLAQCWLLWFLILPLTIGNFYITSKILSKI